MKILPHPDAFPYLIYLSVSVCLSLDNANFHSKSSRDLCIVELCTIRNAMLRRENFEVGFLKTKNLISTQKNEEPTFLNTTYLDRAK